MLSVSVLLLLSAANAMHMTRRAAMLGAAASLGVSPVVKPALAADEAFDTDGIIARASQGRLNIEYAIERARADKRASPREFARVESSIGLAYIHVRISSGHFPLRSHPFAVYATTRDPRSTCTVLEQLIKADKLAQESQQRLVQKLTRRQQELLDSPDELEALTIELAEEKIVLTRLKLQVEKIMSKEEADTCLIDRYTF